MKKKLSTLIIVLCLTLVFAAIAMAEMCPAGAKCYVGVSNMYGAPGVGLHFLSNDIICTGRPADSTARASVVGTASGFEVVCVTECGDTILYSQAFHSGEGYKGEIALVDGRVLKIAGRVYSTLTPDGR